MVTVHRLLRRFNPNQLDKDYEKTNLESGTTTGGTSFPLRPISDSGMLPQLELHTECHKRLLRYVIPAVSFTASGAYVLKATMLFVIVETELRD